MKNTTFLALVGLFLLLPAALLVSSGLLGFNVAPPLIHPVAVMGGLLAAMALNALAVLRLQLEREPHGHLEALTLRIGTKALNLVVLATALMLLAIILGYLFVENFKPR
jgi:hypothetical protein